MSAIEFKSNLEYLTDALHAFAYNLTKNMEDARDLFQETAFRALNNQEKFKADTNFKAWTFTIMKNIFINNYRKKVKSNTFLDYTENQFYLDSGTPVFNDGNKNMLIKELGSMIEKLDDTIKIPFLMHYEGFKYTEIADKFNLPLGTVKSRIFFARRELKEMLKMNYGDMNIVREISA